MAIRSDPQSEQAPWRPQPLQLFDLAFGVAIGVGWIVVVGAWLRDAGPFGAAAAFAVTGLAMLAIGQCYVRLAVCHPGPGGEVHYALAEFNRPTAFWVGWFLTLAYVSVLAFELVALGWIATAMWPDLAQLGDERIVKTALSLAVLLVVLSANIASPAVATRLQDALVLVKTASSIVLIAAALALGDSANLVPRWSGSTEASPVQGFLLVLATAPFFFAGFGTIAQAVDARSIAKPGTLSWVMASTIVSTALFYILVIFAVASAAPRAAILGADFPAVHAFELALNSHLAGQAVLVIGLLGLLTILNGLFFTTLRLLQRLGGLPANRDPIHNPNVAGILVAVFSLGLSALGESMLSGFLSLASASIAVVMSMVCLAALRVEARDGGSRTRLLVPAVAILAAVAIASVSAYGVMSAPGVPSAWGIALAWCLIGALYWFLASQKRRVEKVAE